jgi:hypothetical protein
MLADMRNPIQPSPDRPIPLPDCILLDAWWADTRAELAERRALRRCVTADSQEGLHDKSRGDDRRG